MAMSIEILELMYLQAAKSSLSRKVCLKKWKKDKQVVNRSNPCNFLTWEVENKQQLGCKKSNCLHRRNLAKVTPEEWPMNVVVLSQVLHQCHPKPLATATGIDKHSISKFLRIENFLGAHRQDKHLPFKAWHPLRTSSVNLPWCASLTKERLEAKSDQVCSVNRNKWLLLSIGCHRPNSVHLHREKRCHLDLINQVLKACLPHQSWVIAKRGLILFNLMAYNRKVLHRKAKW